MTDSGAAMNRLVRVRQRAHGIPTPDNFTLSDEPVPPLPDGGVIVRVLLASVDPAMRGWLSAEANYKTVADGAPMPALGVGEIIESDAADWPVGQMVFGWLGWQRFAAIHTDDLMWKIDITTAPPAAWLGPLGLNGLTAWVGFAHLARPRPGETAVVTTASGGVGSIVGQLAVHKGVRAVGVTGGRTKVAIAIEEMGYDSAIDYKAVDDLSAAIAAQCPDGIDIFFDNTAGWIADAIFPHLNPGARVIQCGTASVASWLPVPQGPRRERDVLTRRLSWHGLVVMDHEDRFDAALTELKALIANGSLRHREEILEGIDMAPGAIARLYNGENLGRLLIRP